MPKNLSLLFNPNNPFILVQDETYFKFLRPSTNGVMRSYSPLSDEILKHINASNCVIRNEDGWFMAGRNDDLADFNIGEISKDDVARILFTENGGLIETKNGAVLVAHKSWGWQIFLDILGMEEPHREWNSGPLQRSAAYACAKAEEHSF